jgi:hypothetical protein
MGTRARAAFEAHWDKGRAIKQWERVLQHASRFMPRNDSALAQHAVPASTPTGERGADGPNRSVRLVDRRRGS